MTFGLILGTLIGLALAPLTVALGDSLPPSAPARAPQIDRVIPSSGLPSGGEHIRIEGSGFTSPMKAWVGHTPCDDLEILSPSEMDCIISSHPVGIVDLLVKAPHEFILRHQAFTYAPNLMITPAWTRLVEGAKTSFDASGGIPPYTFYVVQGTSTFDQKPGDGKSGTLIAAGIEEVGIVRVTDSSGRTAEASYRVIPPPPPIPPLKIFPETPVLPVDHALTLTAYGGKPPYEYELMSGPGRFFPSRRVFVSPPSAGKTVIQVTDSLEHTAQITIDVVAPPPLPPRVVAVGDGFSCAAPTGAVSCWGSNSYQQLGDIRARSVNVSTPMKALSSGVASIVSGMHHTCVLIGGGVKCWGGNEYGQLGDGTKRSSSSPRQVIDLESGVLAIAAGDFHTCAVLAHSAVCWGRNDSGQLGDGTSEQSSVPVTVKDLDGKITAIAAGAAHTCAAVNGAAKCWGKNGNGQLGIGNRVDQWTPVAVDGMGSDVQALSAGRAHTCAATSTSLKCWGFNGTGNLGASTAADKSKPYEVQVQSPVSVLASRQYHSCGIVSGSLYCWGYNYQGEVGDSSYLNRWAPVRVNGFSGPVRDVATANFHSCAVVADNQVYCWGDDYFGQLGDGGSARQLAPVRVITEAEKLEMRRKALQKRGNPGETRPDRGDSLR